MAGETTPTAAPATPTVMPAAPAAPATAPTAAPAAPAKVETRHPSVDDILNFDPFAPKEEVEAPNAAVPATVKPAKTEVAPAGPVTPTAPAAPVVAAPVVSSLVTPPEPALAAMQTEMAQMRQLIQTQGELLRAQQQPQGAQPGAPAGPDPLLAQYQFQLPQPFVAALTSDDPAQVSQALSGLMTGLAVHVHKTLVGEMDRRDTRMRQAVPQTVQNTISEQQIAHSVHSDFYGTYKNLNNPLYRQVVVEAGREIMQANPGIAWGPHVGQAVAQRAYQRLAEYGVQLDLAGTPLAPAPVQAPVVQPVLPAGQPKGLYMAGGSAARGEPALKIDPNSPQGIAAALGF